MKKSIFLVGMIIFLMVLVIACAPSGTQSTTSEDKQQNAVEGTGKVVNVAIKGFKFVPADVIVNVGDSIVWTNEDSAPHTVESSDGILKSDELSQGDTYAFTFTKAGKHPYICGIHPSMKGSVTVQ